MLGFRGHPEWRDMSEYIVHFTKPSDDASAYDVILKILAGRTLEKGIPVGAGKGLYRLGDRRRCVCLSEIPLDLLERLIERRSDYGIGFTKEFIVRAGGAPVWYLDDDGEPAPALRQLIRATAVAGDWDNPIWKFVPFIDFPGDYPGGAYRFEWEREWRVPGDLAFEPDDVAFLFLPEEQHEAAAASFEDAVRNNWGPGYSCPFIDASWSMDEIQEAAQTLPAIDGTQESESSNEDTCQYCGQMMAMGEDECLACGRPLP